MDELKAHTPGAEATEEAPQVCTDCGYVLAPMLEHTHSFVDGKCRCGETDPNYIPNPEKPENPESPEKPEKPEEPKGLGAGAIVAIVIGSVLVLGIGGYSVLWFVVSKKSFADLVTVFKTGNFSELVSVITKLIPGKTDGQ